MTRRKIRTDPFPIVGRRSELDRLRDLSSREEAQFLAVYGRRRVGKTYLVEGFFRPKVGTFAHVTGVAGGTRAQQIAIFQREIEQVFFAGARLPVAPDWAAAFELLVGGIAQRRAGGDGAPIVVFLDELPWLATPRSRLLEALDHCWNTRLRALRGFTLVVCGSAAGWMIKHLIDARGGLHNRLTGSMRLLPFTLAESHEYLVERGIQPTYAQTLELFMAIGGVPYYLSLVQRGRSATQNIGHLCFGNGELSGELSRLFRALFDADAGHVRIMKALASKAEGLTRGEIAEKSGIVPGGKLTDWLRELEEAGFVDIVVPYGKLSRDARYRIIDEFVWFAHRWMERLPRGALAARDGSTYWALQSVSPSYRAWAGYAFESICLKHHEQIKRALGISGVAATVAPWRFVAPRGSKAERGAQVDLLFDRADRVITLCEIKYSDRAFTLDKASRDELVRKRDVFRENAAGNRQVVLALITPFGVTQNAYARELLGNVVVLDDLFR